MTQDQADKRLFLLRHAQALGRSESGDKGRALSPKGKDDAQALGQAMQKNGYTPDIILCSPALRTRQTLEGLQKTIEIENVHFIEALYHGSTGDYLNEVQQVSEEYHNILVIAHNPCIYELVSVLATHGEDSVLMRLSEGYAPASLSVISCASKTWADIQPGENTLLSLNDPMDYNAPSRPTRWM